MSIFIPIVYVPQLMNKVVEIKIICTRGLLNLDVNLTVLNLFTFERVHGKRGSLPFLIIGDFVMDGSLKVGAHDKGIVQWRTVRNNREIQGSTLVFHGENGLIVFV